MRAAFVTAPDADDPAGAVSIGEVPAPAADDGWVEVEVHAGALNMHDVWMLRGAVPLADGPTVIGTDCAGTSGGADVVVYPVLARADPGRNVAHGTLVSDLGHGVLSEVATVPAAGIAPKPAHLSWAEAAALPTAWLTAYRMLFTQAGLRAGETVLVQGAGGGVATAAIALASAAGATVVVSSRSPEKAERALAIGADLAIASGARVPELVDVVIDSVGAATIGHSLASARVGGRVVTCGSSTGFTATIDLARMFARELTLRGSTTGTLEEFHRMVAFVAEHRITPVVDSVVDLADTGVQVRRMLEGAAFGKLCVSLR